MTWYQKVKSHSFKVLIWFPNIVLTIYCCGLENIPPPNCVSSLGSSQRRRFHTRTETAQANSQGLLQPVKKQKESVPSLLTAKLNQNSFICSVWTHESWSTTRGTVYNGLRSHSDPPLDTLNTRICLKILTIYRVEVAKKKKTGTLCCLSWLARVCQD